MAAGDRAGLTAAELAGMKVAGRFSISLAAALALTAGAAFADSAPVRHLVYNFDVSFSTTSTIHDSGIGGGPASGSADYRAGTTDKGQIVVDVVTVQPDSGLVVKVAEQARGTRSSEPTMCVAYGNGAVICDQSHGELNEEEAKETNDYTINSTQGDMMNISFQRYLKVDNGQPFDATTDGTISYNQKLEVPATLNEDTITRKNTGMGNYDRIEERVSLNLTTDSMQTAAASH